MKTRHLGKLLIVLFLLSNDSFAQKTTPLREALKKITKRLSTQFVYDRELIAGKTTSYNLDNISGKPVEEVLKAVLYPNNLVFLYITNNYYTIVSKDRVGTQNQPETNIISGNQTLVSNTAYAIPSEKIRITGTVTDSMGKGIPNVTITEMGTKNSTLSSNDGGFVLLVADVRAVLAFSSVGYATRQVPVGNQTTLSINLEQVNAALEEVVLIGYGSQRKIEVTGAVAHVKSEDFIKGSVKDAGQLLMGKVAGLSISTTSGDPTAPSQIILRGIATINSSTQPLILVDGIPGNLTTVAPEDIESIDVLKDGSAAAIYGTRGTNGVILINTKKPNGNIEPTLSYNGYVSTQAFVRVPKMLTAEDFRKKIAEGVPFEDLGSSTDWVKEVSRKNPLSHQHNLAVRGGNAKTNYLATINYRELKGVLLNSHYRTINSRIDLNHSMFDDKLIINFNFINNDYKQGVDFAKSNEIFRDADQSSNTFNQALYRNPTDVIKKPDGSWKEETSISFYMNPLGLLNEAYGGGDGQNTRISGSATWKPVRDLSLRALVSRIKSNTQDVLGHTKKHISNIRDGFNGYARKSSGESTERLLELTTEYSKSLNSHKITALGGYSFQDNIWESTFLRNWNFPAGNYSYIDNIGAGQRSGLGGPDLMNSYKAASNLIGFFGRLRYNYKEKYLLMANLRYEASSRFLGTKNPWGTFPSVSAGWIISEENFLKGSGFLSNLKLRAGYGVTGTAPDELFLGVSLLGYQGSSLINGQWVPSLSPISNPNPNLRWEEKRETNIGLEFGLLAGKISGSIDYYNRATHGLLYDYSVPTPPNAFSTTKANVGIMENKGLEVLLAFIPVQTRKFSWSSSVTFSTNKNKLVSLSNELYETTNPWFTTGNTGSPISTYTHRVEVGLPIGNFYGYKVIDITDDGRWIYENKEGKPSETRAEEDKKILGNGLPKYYASWNNTLRYGNLDLNVTMRGAFGYQILNYQRMYAENPGFTSYNLMKSAFDKIFDKAVLNKNVPVEFNSYYLEEGNFWKIDNITLGYNFDKSIIKHLKSSRLYFSVLNAFILTGYKGMDPEVGLLGLAPGDDDRNKYPTTRVYSIGWNITIN